MHRLNVEKACLWVRFFRVWMWESSLQILNFVSQGTHHVQDSQLFRRPLHSPS
ncbi:MAG: hypothetical protein RLZZ314_267 [Bacteroidota bacterium]|jgi:hypothetical protein